MRIVTIRQLLATSLLLVFSGAAAADELGVTLAREVCRDGAYTLSPMELITYRASDIHGETQPEDDGGIMVAYGFDKIGETLGCRASRVSGSREKSDRADVFFESAGTLRRGIWIAVDYGK
jgi:hypothetical protein